MQPIITDIQVSLPLLKKKGTYLKKASALSFFAFYSQAFAGRRRIGRKRPDQKAQSSITSASANPSSSDERILRLIRRHSNDSTMRKIPYSTNDTPA